MFFVLFFFIFFLFCFVVFCNVVVITVMRKSECKNELNWKRVSTGTGTGTGSIVEIAAKFSSLSREQVQGRKL